MGIIESIRILERLYRDFEIASEVITPHEKYIRGYEDGIKMAIMHLDEHAKYLNSIEEAENESATS
jgi:hypothetical protein